jgi:hypothetical protein
LLRARAGEVLAQNTALEQMHHALGQAEAERDRLREMMEEK